MAGKKGSDRESAADLRTRTPDELETMLLDLKREQFNLRFQAATGQQEGTARVRAVRRSIARVKTLRHQASLSAKAKSGTATTKSAS